MKRDIRFDTVYPHSPERVWRALTDKLIPEPIFALRGCSPDGDWVVAALPPRRRTAPSPK
jgi:uncharacterized protein YndB with AHSA1/START domain